MVLHAMPSYFNASIAGAPCVECRRGLLGSSLRCADCGEGVHFVCSGLPLMSLVRLATTRASFVCGACVRVKAGDKLKEVTEEIERFVEQEKASKKKLCNSRGADESQSATGEESPIPASQARSSQVDVSSLGLGGDDSWAGGTQSQAGETQISELPPGVARTSDASSCGDGSGNRQRNKPKSKSPIIDSSSGGRETKTGAIGICRYYESGSCKHGGKGEGCKYAHPKKCFKFIRFGNDKYKGCGGNKCDFFHPPLCRLTEAGKTCTRKKCKFFHRKVQVAKNVKATFKEDQQTTRDSPSATRAEEVSGRDALSASRRVAMAENGTPEQVMTGGSESWQVNFRLLQDQIRRIERQLGYLLDIRDRGFREEKYDHNCRRDHQGAAWTRCQN